MKMSKKTLMRVGCIGLGVLIVGGTVLGITQCKKREKDSIIIMTEELSGLFNPFYATSGADMDVIGMTQIGMLSTDSNGKPIVGDDQPTVVKAYDVKTVGTPDVDEKSIYTFVLKNDLKFSDGQPLTMEDVLFNMYEYLDPVYTGSSTMYSIDIVGLKEYRTQTNQNTDTASENISKNATASARLRILELVYLFQDNGLVEGSQNSYNLSESEMREAIDNYEYVTTGYMNAVASVEEQKTLTLADYRKMLKADYELTLKTFKEELESDFRAAKESYDLNSETYAPHKDLLKDDLFKFFLYEGYIKPKYAKKPGTSVDDKSKILSFEGTEVLNSCKTQEQAITRVYNDTVKYKLNEILTNWGTAGTLTTRYTADAIDVYMRNTVGADGLKYPNITGIQSLGHTGSQTTINVDGKDYTIARELEADGTPKANEYEVLQITVNGIDPKAIFSFGFTVAPAHYYTASAENPNGVEIDIKNNKFGVEFASSNFQANVIQSPEHLEIPVGAGAFKATNKDNSDTPTGAEFWSENLVYFKANDNFMFPVKAEKLRLQVVSASNAIDKLANDEVDYITPQFTKANAQTLRGLASKGYKQLDSWQLGYGYIGINAGKVPNVNIRRAIMSAMQTSLACEYYEAGTCDPISWPMSKVSWAYPYADDGVNSAPNGRDYTNWTTREAAINKINYYSSLAPNETKKITFTIAGASITEHPTYTVFKQAAELLNECGWDIEVKADSQALTKLSTGSLAVWAAAWGSTIDPDMYQVYHKNSSATSVYSWGYREIKGNTALYSYEWNIIDKLLSPEIDYARSINDEAKRAESYKKAMGYVLDLAVELPVYQRKTLYAYNTNTIKGLTDNVNHYTSPLEKIWELELIKD